MNQNPMKEIAFVLITFVALYGGLWLFNHVNAWIGIAEIILVIYVFIKIILSTIKNKKNNEK